ncbi:MAG: hypothetical protein IPG74_17575 [Flavobacteriales bacterium]|nr:hypothetical protein [Flavobacteriales bacterium]
MKTARFLILLFVVVLLALPACRKDAQFTEDRVELVFSQDTILYDTIFTTVGSITKRFTARNPNDNAVRVDIALQGGSHSPFRINVDGASGLSFTDVEILGGDSIYIFVEATLDANNANNPFIIEDHILFNTNGAEQDVLLLAWGEALGSTSEPIIFQGDRLESLYDNLPGQWDRIWINEGDFANEDNRFENVVIRNSLIGIQCETWPLSVNEPTTINKLVLNNVKILNCSAAGILSRNYRITANNLLVGDAGQYSVALTGGGQYELNHLTVGNFWDWEIRNTPAFIVTNYFQDINGTLQVRDIGASLIRNSIIHGSNTNEFELDLDAAGVSDLTFKEMLFRTDQNVSDPNIFNTGISVNQDPAFVNGSGDDYHLTENSFARQGLAEP